MLSRVGDSLYWMSRYLERAENTVRQLDVTMPADDAPMNADTWQETERLEGLASDRRIAAMGAMLRRELGSDDRHAATLAGEVRARLRDKPPPGTRWAKGQGCGVDVEGEEPMMVACGMGHVPKKAARFLYFFAKRVY